MVSKDLVLALLLALLLLLVLALALVQSLVFTMRSYILTFPREQN